MRSSVIAGTFFLMFQFSAVGAKQLELDCTSELEHFCGGWTVTFVEFHRLAEDQQDHLANDHLKVNHRFVIGTRGNQIWLFPRRDEFDWEEGLGHNSRWGSQVKLVHVFDEAQNQTCLVGDVKVRTGHQGPGEWHRFIITSKIEQRDVKIGYERRLHLEIFDRPGGQPLPQVESCETPDDDNGDDIIHDRHQGVAHVED